MKNKKLLAILIKTGYIFLIISIGMFLLYSWMPQVMDVSVIVKHPDHFKDNIGVVGEVLITKKASYLILDCGENSGCITVPVSYKGERPGAGSKIIAYGKIKKAKGKTRFIERFEAYEIKLRNNDLKGEIFYSIRKARSKVSKEGIIEFRKWLYSICAQCPKLKKKFIPSPLFR
jgi:hypothetical protein